MLKQERVHPLRRFVVDMAAVLDEQLAEDVILAKGRGLLERLLVSDEWLDPACCVPDPIRYRQYLLHCDSARRFSVVSFVWGPGQSTPIHNHTVWGLVGVLRGCELVQPYDLEDNVPVPSGPLQIMRPGDVEAVSPSIGDIHKVSNGLSDSPSVSIHVYGGNIGQVQRSVFDQFGKRDFVSGYSNAWLPNIWSDETE